LSRWFWRPDLSLGPSPATFFPFLLFLLFLFLSILLLVL
jgi:hypothetical protein